MYRAFTFWRLDHFSWRKLTALEFRFLVVALEILMLKNTICQIIELKRIKITFLIPIVMIIYLKMNISKMKRDPMFLLKPGRIIVYLDRVMCFRKQFQHHLRNFFPSSCQSLLVFYSILLYSTFTSTHFTLTALFSFLLAAAAD